MKNVLRGRDRARPTGMSDFLAEVVCDVERSIEEKQRDCTISDRQMNGQSSSGAHVIDMLLVQLLIYIKTGFKANVGSNRPHLWGLRMHMTSNY